jgi:uncharacterized membrane-anchored protein YitT (DUF2179 family)
MEKTNEEKITKQTAKDEGLRLLLIIFGAALHSLGTYVFVRPNGFLTGGVSGIAILVVELTGLSWLQGVTFLALNIPMMILSVLFLGKKFTAKTIWFVLLESGFLLLYAAVGLKQYTFSTPMLAAIAGGVCMGAGQGTCLRMGSSTGGTDIIGLIVRKKHPQIHISWYLFIINGIVISTSFFVYEDGMQSVLLSIILEFVIAKISDLIISGAAGAVRFEIITTKGDAVREAILHRINRGATIFEARGAYSNEEKSVIVCLVHKRQVAEFKKMLKEVDPDAFAYHYNATEVMGKGFSDNNNQ